MVVQAAGPLTVTRRRVGGKRIFDLGVSISQPFLFQTTTNLVAGNTLISHFHPSSGTPMVTLRDQDGSTIEARVHSHTPTSFQVESAIALNNVTIHAIFAS